MERYKRQLSLDEIGIEGQHRLSSARVLIIGAGGLGSPIALYLAAAGVGTLGIVDDDKVSLSNLNRQILYAEMDCGELKVTSATKRIKALRSDIDIHAYTLRITNENAMEIIRDYDIIVDACDNMATRYIIGDITAKLCKPYVYGAITGHNGLVSVFNHGESPRKFRDLWPEEELAIDEVSSKSALGVTAGIVGCVQANEVLKIICHYGNVLANRLWTIDLRTMQSLIVEL